MFLLASGGIFGWLLTIYDFGPLMVDWMKNFNFNQVTMLLVVAVLLLAAGIVIDGLAALLDLRSGLHADRRRLSGGRDPFRASGHHHDHDRHDHTADRHADLYRFGHRQGAISELTCWPFVWAMMVVVVLIILFPPLVTFLPDLVMGKG